MKNLLKGGVKIMSLRKAIYEHLKTKRNTKHYNLRYDVLREELDKKTTELNIERQIWKKKQNIWEQTLKEQEEEIIKLKKRKVKKNV